MDFIHSINTRQKYFNRLIHPHLNDINVEDTLGLYNFELTEVTNPSQELLYHIDKTLGLGYFNTSLKIYKLGGIQFKKPFDKYDIRFSILGKYINIDAYLSTKDAKYYYVDEACYIVCNKFIEILTKGVVLVSLNKNMFSFTNTPSDKTIHLYGDLYIKSNIDFTTPMNTTSYNIKNCTLSNTGEIIDGEDISTEVGVLYAEPTDRILSNGAIVVFKYNDIVKFRLVEMDYSFWNRELGIIDLVKLKEKIRIVYGLDIDDIVSVNVLLQEVDTDNIELTKPEIIFPELFRLSKESKYKLSNIVKNETIGLVPIDGYSRLLDINYGIDKDYFSSVASLSRRVARDLVGKEFSKLHYDVTAYCGDNGLDVIVHNQFQSEINIYINGFFYHGNYTRHDELSISHIKIDKSDLDTYGTLDYIEICVEPMFTKKYDCVVKDGHNNLLEVHGTFSLEKEIDLFINGCRYDHMFWSYLNTGGRGFISLSKDVEVKSATVVYNPKKKYNRTYVNSVSALKDYSIIDEYSKVYICGRLVPNKYLIDLYEDKKLDVLGGLSYSDDRDNMIVVHQLDNNPIWNNYLMKADTDHLISSFVLIDNDKRTIKYLPYSEIVKRINYIGSTNSMKNNEYITITHADNVMKRTEFVYDMLGMGSKVIELDCNVGIISTDIFSEIDEKYGVVVDKENIVIVDCNQETTPMVDITTLRNK